MDLTDKLKNIKGKVEDAAVEHEEQIRGAVDKAKATADQKSGGKYTAQIRKAGDKADAVVDKLTAAKKSGGQR